MNAKTARYPFRLHPIVMEGATSMQENESSLCLFYKLYASADGINTAQNLHKIP